MSNITTTISNNNNSNYIKPECLKQFAPQVIENNGKALIVIYSILCGFIVISNGILIYGLIKTKLKTFTISNKLFIFLSSVDLLTALILLPYSIYMLKKGHRISCIDTGLRSFIAVFLAILSGQTVVLIAIERNCLIGHKLAHRKYFSEKRLLVYLLLAILVSFVWGMVYCFISQQVDLKQFAIIFMSLGVYEIILLISAILFNIKILQKVVFARRNSTLSLSNKRTERKLSRTITIIAATLVICYIPSALVLIRVGYLYYTSSDQIIISSATMILYWSLMPLLCNHGLNSCIYIVRSNKIRRYLCGGKSKNIYGQSQSSSQQQQNSQSRTNFGKIPLKNMSSVILPGAKSKQEKRKISQASATCEIKRGVLVPKTKMSTHGNNNRRMSEIYE